MSIDWKAAAKQHQAAYVDDLTKLIAIESVRDDSKKRLTRHWDQDQQKHFRPS